VLYTYGDGWVALLGVDNRRDVYDQLGNLVVEVPTASVKGIPEVDELLRPADPPTAAWSSSASARAPEADGDVLPVHLDADLLRRLRVPEGCIPALSTCRTLDDLLDAPVPESVRMLVFEAVTAPDLDRVLQQPTYVTGDVSDLLKFAEGELLGFLLKLNPEQEKFVTWAVHGAGPTLVKGGPGTGKSTIALYRTKALIEHLCAEGVAAPRILFTTYTNALVAFSRQLLGRLLGRDASHVEIRTADGLLREIVERADGRPDIVDSQQLAGLVQRAVTEARFDGNALQRRSQARTLERLTPAYLLEEIETVIVARELSALDEYLATPRAGREVPLNNAARTAVWRVHESLTRILTARKQVTWSRLRARGAELIRAGRGSGSYDGVVVDEAQDLEPTVLRALVALCRTTDRLFITADANQSIYGSGFRWTDVHEDLRFRGRTGTLRTNHRSTEQIGEAAHAYLARGAIDEGGEQREYAERGALPAVRAVPSQYDQVQLLARYLRGASRELRLGVGACAVLVPTRDAGRAIAGELAQLDVPATFMQGDSLELDAPCVKVLTLKSAKGLEFPIVTIAGLLDDPEPGVPRRGDAEERLEALRRERRTVFVGMTRAMRALLLVTPAGKRSELLDGFDSRYWNLQ
jgi:superfamily I DNA/RNA helicase